MRLSRGAKTTLMVGVFLVAFVLRAYRPLSRPLHWLTWTGIFNRALDNHKWVATYQASIPGVTAMAISGASLRLYDAVRGTPAEVLMSWAIPPYATKIGERVVAGVFGLALVIAGSIVATTLSLRKLGDWALALAAAGLLIFSPFYLSQSRVYNLDGLVSALMLLSALLLLVNLESGQRRYLLLSGFVGGLAVLTKVSAVFLLPYTGLALLVHLVRKLRASWSEGSQARARWLLGETWCGLVWPGLLWLLMAVLPFALWPAMWVEPLKIKQEVLARVTDHIGVAHPTRFFAGRIYDEVKPPILFYPVSMVFKSSFLTLTLALVGLGHYTLWRKRGRLPLQPITFWLLVAFAFFFTLQMMIGADQDWRYILPAYLILEVLAAVGLVGAIDLLGRATAEYNTRLARALPTALVSIVVALQALIALPYAPDYGAQHNHLLGGNRVAVKMVEITGQNEGITYVADYLSHQPDAKSMQIGGTKGIWKSLQQYFPGEVRQAWSDEDDYHLATAKYEQRTPEAWGQRQSLHEGNAPQVLVVIDGVEYMWLYATQPPASYDPVVIRRGGGIAFIVLAWVWTAALGTALVWSLRHAKHAQLPGET